MFNSSFVSKFEANGLVKCSSLDPAYLKVRNVSITECLGLFITNIVIGGRIIRPELRTGNFANYNGVVGTITVLDKHHTRCREIVEERPH